jgi:ligand-binding sensor domain-containing protein/DNA-binding CsgD family transcriptional regulator
MPELPGIELKYLAIFENLVFRAKMKKHITLFLVLFIALHLFAVSVKRTGFSFVQNYSKQVYQAGTQVWSISQDRQGMMYFGNNSGLLTYDGRYWNLFPVTNGSVIRSVKVTHDGRVYVGASNEFGYFIFDPLKGMKYTSLLEMVPIEYRDFGEVWNIAEYNGGILFHSFNALFFYKNNKIEVISFDRNLHFSFAVDSEIFIREIDRGLLKLEGLQLIQVKQSEKLGVLTVTGIIRLDEKNLLIATREQGLYVLDANGVREFNTILQQYLRDNQIFCTYKISYEFFALGTVQDGVIIIDRQGKLVQHLDRECGLQNNTILSLSTDHDGNLWLGLDNGIDFILLNSPLSYFAHQNDVGAVYAIQKKDDFLYLGTNQGLFSKKWPCQALLPGSERDFHFIEGSQGQVWTLDNKNGVILVGHDKGTFYIDRQRLTRISSYNGGWTFAEVPGNPDLLIEGMYSGLILDKLYTQKGKPAWKYVRNIPGFNQSCKEIYFDDRGYLWVGHGYKGVYRLRLTPTFDSIDQVIHYAKNSGLPSNYNLNVQKFNNQIIVSSDKGIYLFDYLKENFYKSEELTKLFENKNVFSLIEDQLGNIWYFTGNGMGILKPNFDGTYTKISVPFASLKNKLIASYENIYSIDRSNILIPNEDGVIHFDPSFNKEYNKDYTVLVRRVEILNDSVLFAGTYNCAPPIESKVIRYAFNHLWFTYAAVFYEQSESQEYSYKLEGFDDRWSEWSNSSEKEYTNLPEGTYSFKVKSKNIYGKICEATPYHFIILPPFYRSTIAYILFAIFFAAVIGVIILLVIRKIEKEKHALKEKQRIVIKEKERVFEEASLKAEQEIIRLKNEKLEAENQKNHTELDSKNKELASITMQITYKNELLNRVKQKLARVSEKMLNIEIKQQVVELVKTLDKDLAEKDDWEKFEVHFDQVHEDFLKKLRRNYPELTPKDLHLCAYLKMNLSSKEIAPLLNISIRGVEISRYRLRKKMSLTHNANLTEFMMNL